MSDRNKLPFRVTADCFLFYNDEIIAKNINKKFDSERKGLLEPLEEMVHSKKAGCSDQAGSDPGSARGSRPPARRA